MGGYWGRKGHNRHRKWLNSLLFPVVGRAHRLDMGPSKPRVAGSNPAGRAIFLENSLIVPIAWAPGAKVQANKVTGHLPRLAD